MRVLLISHTCQSRTEGQPKAEKLAQRPDLDLRVLVPDRWLHYGHWRGPDDPGDAAFSYQVGRVAFPWTGPGQCFLHWYPELGRTLREFQPDVIDLWEEAWGLVSAQTCWLRDRILPAARIITETEQNIDKRLPPPFEAFRRYTLRRADFAVARNRDAVEVLRRKGYTGPAEVVPNAVDTDVFQPLDRDACRAGLGLSGFVVGYVGRLVPEKGLEDMVRALPFCDSSVKLLLVGSGPLELHLRQVANGLGVSDRVQVLPGMPQSDLPRVMNAIDVLALVSRTLSRWKEQFGRVIIEAHACGIPVIGSDSGAIPDVVGQGGLIVPEQNPEALARAIERFRTEPALCRQMALAGRAQVAENYTWERVADRMAAIYPRLVPVPSPERKTPSAATG